MRKQPQALCMLFRHASKSQYFNVASFVAPTIFILLCRKTLAVNVEAPLLLTGELYARDLIQPYESTNSVRMIPEGFGGSSECVKPGRTRIMVMGSGAAHKPVAGWPTYGPSKAALYAAVRQMIAEGTVYNHARTCDQPLLAKYCSYWLQSNQCFGSFGSFFFEGTPPAIIFIV